MLEGWVSLMVAIENNALATWLRSSAWGYPAVETLHILGLALLFGTAVAFDLRLLSMPFRCLWTGSRGSCCRWRGLDSP